MGSGCACRVPSSSGIRAAPSTVPLCDRNGKPAMYLEDHKTYYGTGSDTPFVIDPYTGERRQSRLQDVANMARLVDALPNIDFLMSMGIAQDLEQTYADVYHMRTMLENTTKPICYTAWNVDNLKASWSCAEHRRRAAPGVPAQTPSPSCTPSRSSRCSTSSRDDQADLYGAEAAATSTRRA